MTTQHTITTAFPESEQGDSIFSAEYHYRPESASALPVVIFTLYPIQELHGLGQALAAAGHPCTVATFRSFPWEDAAEEAAYIYRLLAAHAPFDWGMPCLYGLGFDALTALRLASAMPAGTFSALALGYFSTALQTSWLCSNGVLTGSGLQEILEAGRIPVTPALLASFSNWGQKRSPFTSSGIREEWLLALCRQDGAFFRDHHEFTEETLPPVCRELPLLLLGSTAHASAGGVMELSWKRAQTPHIPFELHLSGSSKLIPEEYSAASESTSFLIPWLKNHDSASKAHNYCYFMSDAESSGSWRTSKCWPPRESTMEIWYLDACRMRPAPPPDFAPPATTFSSEWGTGRCTAEFCPDFSIVEALTSQEIPSAYADGTAVFSMRRCLNNLELLGIPRVSLWVTCTRSDAAFAARLTVLPPPGICCLHPAPLLISSGICRLALRSDPLLPMLSDGEQIPVQLNFQLHPVSVRIPAGSMLRLEITSGDSPRFLPVLLAPSPAPRRWESTIWHNARHPSRLILPVLNKDPPSSAPNRI